jgi:hypothetical protein
MNPVFLGSRSMEDRILAEQLAKTGNLMDLCSGDDWLKEIDDPEEDGWVEAGLMAKPYVERLKAASPEDFKRQRRYMRLLSILSPELQRWLQTWHLGLSLEAVFVEAQQRVYAHLKQLTPEQQTWMDALLAEDDQSLPMAERAMRSQSVAMLLTLFTPDDWQAFARVAAEGMSQGVLQLAQTQTVPPIAV